MCETCGCNVTSGNRHFVEHGGKLSKTPGGAESVTVLRELLAENDHQAAHNREHFDRHGVLTVNLMSAPGSGKTALLEATIQALGDDVRIAVIEGDLETENDAERIRRHGIEAIQISTGSACHLDAHLVHDALHQMDLTGVDILFVENVGNLVCPASFDLGQHRNVILLSVPEGDDKPAKYPVMFRAADLVMLSKADLLDVMPEFDPGKARAALRDLGKDIPIMQVSSKTWLGVNEWVRWLKKALASRRRDIARGEMRTTAAQSEIATAHAHPDPK